MRLRILGAAVLALVACGEGAEPPVAAPNPLADSADQVMFGIRWNMTTNGVLRARLLADTAYFFDDNARMELRDVHMTFFDAIGQQTSVLTSREGTYNTRLSTAEARGDVVMVGEEGRRLTTEQMRYNQSQNLVSSDSAFVFTGPNQRLEGIGFVSDPEMSNVRILGQPSGGTTFTLPGQGSP
ncbi:MAG: LPS export ABC transporter periplasmic protein LptC [Gemmatimonadaceae bacterium]